MIKIYKDNLSNVVYNLINDKILCNLLILDLNNIKYNGNYENYIQSIKDILSISSYIIKNGGNIIIIANDIIKDIDLSFLLSKELLWDKHNTIIYNFKLKSKELLSTGYSYIFWYSNNYRKTDPTPICNNFDNGNELTDFWDINTNIYKRIITMFSNENDIIFEPYIKTGNIKQYCETLNRNYIGVESNE